MASVLMLFLILCVEVYRAFLEQAILESLRDRNYQADWNTRAIIQQATREWLEDYVNGYHAYKTEEGEKDADVHDTM